MKKRTVSLRLMIIQINTVASTFMSALIKQLSTVKKSGEREEEKVTPNTLRGWGRYQNLGHILEAVEVIDDPNLPITEDGGKEK